MKLIDTRESKTAGTTSVALATAAAIALAVACLMASNKAKVAAASSPRHYSHIRTYASFYGNPKSANFTPVNQRWLADHIDIAAVAPTMTQRAANTQLVYINWQDLKQSDPLYTELMASAIADKSNAENLFFHFGKDVAVPLQTSRAGPSNLLKALREERFLSALSYHAAGNSFSDVTPQAAGDVVATQFARTYDISGPAQKGDALYVGSADPFQTIRLMIHQPAGSGWLGQLTYWSGNAWQQLSLSNDGARGYTQSGVIRFEPPSHWNRNEVNHLMLYWVRLVCLSSDGTPPVFRSTVSQWTPPFRSVEAAITKEPFAIVPLPSAGGGGIPAGVASSLVPGWDPANDPNHDGYVDDREFAARPNPTASARFEWQSRMPSSYADGRWQANLGSAYYQNFAAKKTSGLFANNHPFDGVFVDNASAFIANILFSAPPNDGSYKNYFREFPNDQSRQDLVNDLLKTWNGFLTHLKTGTGNKMVFANVGSNLVFDRVSGPDVPIESLPAIQLARPVTGVLVEHAFSWTESIYDSTARLPRYRDAVKAFCHDGKSIAFQGEARSMKDAQASALKTMLTLQRAQIYGLARFYLTAEDCAFFDFQDDYSQPWVDWFPAIAFDVGRPQGDYFNLQSESELSISGPPAALDNVVGRHFQKAFVLVKTRAHASSAALTDAQSQVTISLGRDYAPLLPDGTLGPAERKLILSDFEAAILIPSSARASPPGA